MPLYALIAGGVIFFGTHAFTMFRSRSEQGLRAKLGYRGYMGLYSLLALIGLGLFAWGWANMRPWPQVWMPPEWTRHLVMGVMPFAMILLVAAYTPVGYIKKYIGHPMLVAVMLWSGAHLAANGDLGAIVLFGAFFLYAALDRVAVAARGDNGPVGVKPHITGDMMAIAGGFGAYVLVVFWLHPLIIGVNIIG